MRRFRATLNSQVASEDFGRIEQPGLVPQHDHHFLHHLLGLGRLHAEPLQVGFQPGRKIIEQFCKGRLIPPDGDRFGKAG